MLCSTRIIVLPLSLNSLITEVTILTISGKSPANGSSKKKISAEDVEEAIKKIKESKPEIESEEKIREMDNDEKLLWGIIKENNGKSSTEIHDIYTKRSGKEIKYRRFKDSKLNVLRDLGFINLEEVSLGTYGTKTIVNLNKNKKLDEF